MVLGNDMFTKLVMIADSILLFMTCIISGGSDYANIEVQPFSYQEVIDNYDINEYYPGVHFDGFNNNSVCNISNAADAVKQAKKECREGFVYDSINVYHDESQNMWEIMFYRKNWTGGYSVYMNGQGITTLIIAGE